MAAEKPENLGDPTKIGNIEIFEKSNRKFSNPKSNSLIFRGKFEGKIEVFIRRFEKVRVQPPKANELEKKTEKEKEFEREMELLHEPGKTSYMHENFTRYFCCKGKGDFYYVAIEWCICSVDDLVQRRKGYDWEGKEIDTELIVPSLGKKEILREEEEIDENLKKKLINLGRKEILRQATEGLVFLHAMGFVYRNVKPSNFMIAQVCRPHGTVLKYLVKVTDFRMSKKLIKESGHSGDKGSEGWISPYPKINTTDKRKKEKEINTHPSEDNEATHPSTTDAKSKENDAKEINTHPSEDDEATHPSTTDATSKENDTKEINTHPSEDDEATHPSITDATSKENNAKEINTHPSEDVFTLGCFYHYVLTGKHPFGDNSIKRVENIRNDGYEVYKPDWKPNDVEEQAASLLKNMIKYHPEDRPALKTILGRAYFLPDDYYKLYDLEDKKKPGLCVIFNQNKFIDKEYNRDGTDEDKKALTDVFKEFGFKVNQYDDLSEGDLTKEIDALQKQDFSNYACLVICILSHGDKDIVYGTDFGTVSIEESKRKFNDNYCQTLRGKPKIWIIQACQGILLQEDFETSIHEQKNLSSADSVSQGIQPISYQPPDVPRPPMSEMLDIRATIPGFFSFRDPKKGTVLIRNLCKQLRKTFLDEGNEKSNRHLEDLLKMVQKSISEEESWILAFKDDKENMKEMLNRIKKKIETLEKENPTDVKEKIDKEYAKLDFQVVTEDDVVTSGNKINLTFRKIIDEEKKIPIFSRPCKQTIEWRSTLTNFIRFEKSVSPVEVLEN